MEQSTCSAPTSCMARVCSVSGKWRPGRMASETRQKERDTWQFVVSRVVRHGRPGASPGRVKNSPLGPQVTCIDGVNVHCLEVSFQPYVACHASRCSACSVTTCKRLSNSAKTSQDSRSQCSAMRFTSLHSRFSWRWPFQAASARQTNSSSMDKSSRSHAP